MHQTLTEILRRELPKMGSLNSIEHRSGVKRQSIAKFLRGERFLRLDSADKLAQFLGVQHRIVNRKGKYTLCGH